jgi:hypothetical protein
LVSASNGLIPKAGSVTQAAINEVVVVRFKRILQICESFPEMRYFCRFDDSDGVVFTGSCVEGFHKQFNSSAKLLSVTVVQRIFPQFRSIYPILPLSQRRSILQCLMNLALFHVVVRDWTDREIPGAVLSFWLFDCLSKLLNFAMLDTHFSEWMCLDKLDSEGPDKTKFQALWRFVESEVGKQAFSDLGAFGEVKGFSTRAPVQNQIMALSKLFRADGELHLGLPDSVNKRALLVEELETKQSTPEKVSLTLLSCLF